MARTIAVIQSAIISNLVASAAAVGVTITPSEWSNYDYRQLLSYVVAVAIATVEQLWDAFTGDIEALIAVAAPQTKAWFQAQMFKFQYSATDPQIVQLDTTDGTFAPYYVTVNPTLQIIKYCSVRSGSFGTVDIKVAGQSSGLPVALTSPQLAAAQGYVNEIPVPGIVYNVVSANSDKIKVSATVYFNGLYAGVLAINDGTVVQAMQAYLAAIPFNGVFTLSDLEGAIKAVPGVIDLVFTNVQARADTTAYGAGTDLVIGVDGIAPTGNIIARNFSTIAGYIETETTATHTINDTLTYVAN